MEGIIKKYTSSEIMDVVDIRRDVASGFDPEPVTIPFKFVESVKKWPTYPAIVSKEDKIYTYKDYYDNAIMFSKSLLAMECNHMNVVCAIGYTSPEYLFSIQGTWLIGCVNAGIYTTNSAEACYYILHHSSAIICVCEGGENASKIASIRHRLPNLKAIVVFWPENGIPEVDPNDGFAAIYSWNDFLRLGLSVRTASVMQRMEAVKPGNCASLIYTSGTTGDPKGVMLTHDNATFNAQAARNTFLFDDTDRLVSYLPMNHIAAQFLDAMAPTCNRITVYMAKPDAIAHSLNETLKKARPTLLLAVPRVWEKFGEAITAESLKFSWAKRAFVNWSRKIGLKACLSRQFSRKTVKPFLFSIADKFCFQKVKRQLGLECCRTTIVCAAPVTDETLHFFASFDIALLDLYGQSEGTAPVTCNSHNGKAWKLFSSGKPLPGISCRIDPLTSEIQYKGRCVMMGYLHMESETENTIDGEGWIHTGDQGKIDSDGFLTITGRLKELIVTAGGENVPPVPIELTILEACPALSNCVVVGDRRKFLSCLVSLKTFINPITGEPTNDLALSCIEELKKIGSTATTVTEAKNDYAVMKMIDNAVTVYNTKAVSRAQNIRKWILLDRDLSLASGELTATLKLRRGVVQKNYENNIDALYK